MIASNQTFIIAAYAVTWMVIAGYLFYLARTGRRAQATLERARTEAAEELRS
jgi:CcmD family protein